MLFFYYLCPRFWSLEINYALQPASCRALPVLYLRVHVLRFLRLPSIWTPDSLPSGLWPSCSSASSRRPISPICPIGPIRLIAERERILAHIKSAAKVIKKMHICKSFLFFICIYAFFLLPLPSLLVFGNKLRPPTRVL